MRYQFVRKKQTVHPAFPNSDTLVDASATVYQIHIGQGSPNILGEDHVSHKLLHNSLRAGHLGSFDFFGICYILPNQDIFRKCIIIFSLLAKCVLRPGEMDSQVGFDPRAMVWRTLMQTMKRIGDSTHHCQSPTPIVNGCCLTPSTRTQSSEQEYSYLTASKRHPSTPYSRHIPQSFSQGTQPYTFPRSTKHM